MVARIAPSRSEERLRLGVSSVVSSAAPESGWDVSESVLTVSSDDESAESAGPVTASTVVACAVRTAPGRTTRSALFLDLRLLAAQFAQVIQLGASHVTAGNDVDVIDVGRVHREGPLRSEERRVGKE